MSEPVDPPGGPPPPPSLRATEAAIERDLALASLARLAEAVLRRWARFHPPPD